ncbi:ABC transporter permease/M1 family aminopeptidase [Polluticoccus soli]|uniref:ABC transporter permease/M1 family aminopeptidase n=1 Tax=Polluticoccus soli TaxID=3034150 RepID=UPI0023E0D62D|nr:M1 family aminopeptidase [Flavipsychrobacter sp. JY13-12]
MWKFITYEWKYWLRSPMTWILFLINAALIFGAVSSDNISIGGGVGNVYKNAPHAVQNYYGVMSLICLLMTTAFMNATANRDFQYNMYQLVFSSPIRKRDYFFGKFIGAATMAVIPLLGVSLGALLGPLMPWVSPERYGPVVWSGHLWGLVGFGIPNIFITGVLLFSLSLIFRSNIISFVGAIGILVLYAVSAGFTKDIQNEWLANILDPFGFRPQSLLSKYMTVSEKNTHAIPLQGAFLWNRVIWMSISAVLLFVMYFRFSFNTRKEKAAKQKISKQETFIATQKSYQPAMAGSFSLSALLYLVRFEVKSIIKHPTFIIIAAIGAINLIAALTSFTGNYGATQYPVTYDVVDSIRGSFYLFLIAIITFYSGVLVWKERDAKINEIQDSTPVKTGMLFTSKLVAMIITVAIVLAGTIVIGMIAQLCYGYTRLQAGVYIKSLLIMDMLNFTYLVIAALFFHYLINNRYVAYFAFIAFVIVNTFIWSVLEVETNMVDFGSTPNVIYSDMNGFGPFTTTVVWFNIYWSLCVLLVSYVIYAFYIRGRENAFAARVKYAGHVLRRNLAIVSVAAIAFIACSGFVFYNTKVLNTYESSDETERKQVDYENKYKKYEGAAQPRWYSFDYHIDLEPYERNMKVMANAWVRNISGKQISEIYFNLPEHGEDLKITVPGSKVKSDDKRLKFRIVALDKPMQPGDSLPVQISFEALSRGFENEVSFKQLTQNGTFFNNYDIMPSIGYSASGELSDKNKRKKYKLPVRRRAPLLNENDMVARSNNYVISDADWVTINTVISTAKDQVAVAPGSLVRSWEQNGKRYFNYKLDQPSLNFYSFISAKYEVARKKWNGIDIEVYYHKEHGYNVPNMLNSIEKSLDYYTTNFGPYYHKQARIIEFPRYSSFAQAFPGTMPYSEGIGFITDLREVTKDDIDFVFYVVAHEMGHQYWAHQLCGANMQGSEMMSEGFAQYSSLMVMEKEYGKDKMKQFLKYEMDGYLRGRSREFEAERPIIKTESQQYIHYQKASVVLYYVKEMIGEDKVNLAMRSLINDHAYKQPPYPTALSALRAFRAVTPDSLQYVVTDLFENITLFSNRVTDASYTKVGDQYKVEIKTISEKYYSDSLGKETTAPMNDFIDIGVFAEAKDKKGIGKPLAMQRVRLNKRDNVYTFYVTEKPYQAGIDPYNYLVDRLPDDNVKRIN